MRKHVMFGSASVVIASLGLAACTGGSVTPTPNPSPSSSASAAAPTTDPEEHKIIIASPSAAGFSHLPLYITADRLNEQGWDVEFVNLTDNDLAFQAVISGEAQISHGATGNALLAIQKDANLTLLADRNKPEWALVAKAEITECSDITPETLVARHSANDSIYPQMKPYFDTCGADPTVLLIAGSENRIAALQSGHLDMSPVELGDWMRLSAQDTEDQFHLLAFLGDSLPLLSASGIYANAEWVSEHRQTTVDFLSELLRTHRELIDDPSILEAAAERHDVGGDDPEILRAQIDEYISREMWAVNGGLSDEVINFTIQFNTETEYLEPGLTADEVWDPTILQEAVEAVGAIPGKP